MSKKRLQSMNKEVLKYRNICDIILSIRRLNNGQHSLKRNCNKCLANYFQYPASNYLISGCRFGYKTKIENEKQFPLEWCPKPLTKVLHEKECEAYRKEKMEIYKFLGILEVENV